MNTAQFPNRTRQAGVVPILSVVVLSYNGIEHLPECLQTIFAQDFKDFEVIVVDNGSTDGSVEYIKNYQPAVTLIQLNQNMGFCIGMNRGAEEAKGKFVLLLNQDLSLDKSCFSALMKSWDNLPPDNIFSSKEERPVIGVFPKVLFYSTPGFINAFGAEWFVDCHWRDSRVGLPDLGAFEKSETVFGSIFPAVLFDKEKFQKIGGFDPIFVSYCEDFDVCYRSNILGYRFITAPKAIIKHKYRASSTDQTNPLQSRFWFLRNYMLVFLKNYEGKNLVKYGNRIFKRYIWNSMRHAFTTRNRAEFLMNIRVLGSILKKIPGVFRARRQIQNNRKYKDQIFWQTGDVEDFNIFHVEGCIVLSVKSLRAGKGDNNRLQ